MPPDHGEAARWLEKGDQDRSAAARLFTPECVELAVVGFLCQQAIEKYLKALIVARGVEPERTHDLRRLAEACAPFDPGIAAMSELVGRITVFAVTHRYPGPADPLSEEVRSALEVLESVRRVVRRALGHEP